jgi:hypothetical protein
VPALFVADPFMVQHASRWYLFCEVMNGDTGLGEIGFASSEDGFSWEYHGTVLRQRFHLSYPHIYRWGADFYMVPETVSEGKITAYRAERFPYDWRPVESLLAGVFADPTIFSYDGRWWMYVCTNPLQHDALSLYHASQPLGPWRAHACNPLLQSYPRAARPAGKVIETEEGLLRFSQDCVPLYGSGVRVSRVHKITPYEYAEKEAEESPLLTARTEWNSTGMHHVDAHQIREREWIACVDGYRLD